MYVISWSWTITYLISKLLLPLSHSETTAFWCTMSVISVPAIVLYSWYESRVRKPKIPETPIKQVV